jgi:hypothetical protein
LYSVRLGNGKLQWQTVIPGGILPLKALYFEQQPTVLPESIVVALRHSIVAFRRDISSSSHDVALSVSEMGTLGSHQWSSNQELSDAGEGGQVMWQLQLPQGMVVEGWAKLELHAGALLLRISDDPNALGSDKARRRMLLSLDPEIGEVRLSELLRMYHPCHSTTAMCKSFLMTHSFYFMLVLLYFSALRSM